MPQADPDLRVTVRPHPRGPYLMSVSGELDYHTSSRLRAGLEDVPLEQGVSLIIDLSRLTYCDSTGISVLIGAYHRSRAAGGVLALTGMNPDIARSQPSNWRPCRPGHTMRTWLPLPRRSRPKLRRCCPYPA